MVVVVAGAVAGGWLDDFELWRHWLMVGDGNIVSVAVLVLVVLVVVEAAKATPVWVLLVPVTASACW